MARRLALLAGLVLVGAGVTAWAVTRPQAHAAYMASLPAGLSEPNLANGETLYHAGGCASCHAVPGQDDKNRLGGGLRLETSFGTFVAPNISPDTRDGIGGWTELQFVNAMRAGVSPDGEHYYPAFPYTSYQRMGAQDLRDLFAFMKTLPSVSGQAGEHELSFPFNVRQGIGLWKALYLDGKVFEPDPSRSAAWNRGAYLVEGPGHCAECHSPRNRLGAIEADRRYAGGPDPEGRGFVPNITPHPTGIGDWTREDIVEVLTTGFTPEFDAVGSTMTAVSANTAKLSDEDRAAMAEYIATLPARETRR